MKRLACVIPLAFILGCGASKSDPKADYWQAFGKACERKPDAKAFALAERAFAMAKGGKTEEACRLLSQAIAMVQRNSKATIDALDKIEPPTEYAAFHKDYLSRIRRLNIASDQDRARLDKGDWLVVGEMRAYNALEKREERALLDEYRSEMDKYDKTIWKDMTPASR